MSLLTQYGHRPSHFHLSITFPPLWIPQSHDAPLWHHAQHPWAFTIAHSHCPTLIGPITNHTYHQTSFTYRMYMWPTDPAVTFPFLDRSPHCFLMIFSLFYFTDLPLWYPTAWLSYPTHPDAGWPVSSHCTTRSVSQGTVAILPRMILVLVSLIVIFVFNHL